MYLSFQVSVHHSGEEDRFMASEIHPRRGGPHGEYKYMCVCAAATATLDKPTAVNYELACGEGDRLVNMQSRRTRSAHATQVSDPHCTRSGRG